VDSMQAGGVTNGRISLVDYSTTRCAGRVRMDGWPHLWDEQEQNWKVVHRVG
jgi:hypothetical protein